MNIASNLEDSLWSFQVAIVSSVIIAFGLCIITLWLLFRNDLLIFM
jgi:hypothetical protein